MADITGSLGQQIQEVKVLGGTGTLPTDVEVAATNTGAAAAITATLAGAAGKTTYIEGVQVGGLGATAASRIAVTITGLAATITLYVEVPAGATVIAGGILLTFPSPIPASAVNTAIVVNVPSFGTGNTDEFVSAWGFQR